MMRLRSTGSHHLMRSTVPLMNWLGDLFDEDTPLAVLKICVLTYWPILVDPDSSTGSLLFRGCVGS